MKIFDEFVSCGTPGGITGKIPGNNSWSNLERTTWISFACIRGGILERTSGEMTRVILEKILKDAWDEFLEES